MSCVACKTKFFGVISLFALFQGLNAYSETKSSHQQTSCFYWQLRKSIWKQLIKHFAKRCELTNWPIIVRVLKCNHWFYFCIFTKSVPLSNIKLKQKNEKNWGWVEEKNEPFFIQHHYDRLFKTIEDEWRKKMNRFSSNIIMIGCLIQLRMSGGKKWTVFHPTSLWSVV